MAKIITKGLEFTGSIGPVRFDNGEAETDLPAMVAHFKRDPARYEVTEGEQPEQPEQSDPEADANDADEPGEQPEDADEQPDPEADDTEGKGREALRDMARERGLPVSGSRDELAARIREHDDNTKGTDDTGE